MYRLDLSCLISAFLSSSLLKILFALFISISTTDHLCCRSRWWFDPKFRYWSVCVPSQYTVTQVPHSPPDVIVCPGVVVPSHSSSIVNLMLMSLLFRCWWNSPMNNNPLWVKVSSTYLSHIHCSTDGGLGLSQGLPCFLFQLFHVQFGYYWRNWGGHCSTMFLFVNLVAFVHEIRCVQSLCTWNMLCPDRMSTAPGFRLYPVVLSLSSLFLLRVFPLSLLLCLSLVCL